MSELAHLQSRRIGEIQLASISGEIDLSNARPLIDAIAATIPDDAALLVLDLSRTTYVDSAGIAAIFRLAERLRIRRQDLRLVVAPDSPIRAVLRLTHLDHVIQIDDTAPEPPRPDAPAPPGPSSPEPA
jgi:anti-anti-sigma factor